MRWWSTAATQSNKWALRFCSCTFFGPISNTIAAVSAKWSCFFELFVLRMILIGLICVISVTNLASILEESCCSPVDYEPQSWKEISEGANKIKQVERCLPPPFIWIPFFRVRFVLPFPHSHLSPTHLDDRDAVRDLSSLRMCVAAHVSWGIQPSSLAENTEQIRAEK